MGLMVVALIAIGFAIVISSGTGSSAERPQACTHGASSLGPIYFAHNQVVGSTTPHTDACLP
jgi:hypothetical protein